jgi:1-acyl-sn-glycerol-3-phosphate acyltransferase
MEAKDVDAVIATFVLVIIYIILAIPAALTLIPWAMITGQADPLYNVAQLISRAAFAAAGIRVQVTGRELIPAGQACIFMSNHLSNLDPPSLFPRIPGRTSAFLKRSLMLIPVLGYGLKLAEFIPVDREGRAESAQESAAIARRVLGKGIHIAIFVEGTRSPDGRMLPFKKGPFYLAMESGAPCIPVSIDGTERIMPKGSIAIHPGTVHVTFHPPVDPRKYPTREELMEAVRKAIDSGLPEWMRS